VAAAALLVAEFATATLACAMLGLSAGVAALLAVLGVPLAGQLAAFVASSGLLVGVLRPAVMHRQDRVPGLRTGVAALVGSDAVVTSRVDGSHDGRIKLAGQTWSARAYDPGAVFEPGEVVHVAVIDGATALVL
jgi:membrane protein implicated in regulation of membrane protease activity